MIYNNQIYVLQYMYLRIYIRIYSPKLNGTLEYKHRSSLPMVLYLFDIV